MFYSINFLDPRDNFYIMTIILLAIFIAWFVVFTKEASAPPVVIDNTLTRKEQKTNLLTSSDGNSNSQLTLTAFGVMEINIIAKDSTNYYVWGNVISATAPAFADQ